MAIDLLECVYDALATALIWPSTRFLPSCCAISFACSASAKAESVSPSICEYPTLTPSDKVISGVTMVFSAIALRHWSSWNLVRKNQKKKWV